MSKQVTNEVVDTSGKVPVVVPPLQQKREAIAAAKQPSPHQKSKTDNSSRPPVNVPPLQQDRDEIARTGHAHDTSDAAPAFQPEDLVASSDKPSAPDPKNAPKAGSTNVDEVPDTFTTKDGDYAITRRADGKVANYRLNGKPVKKVDFETAYQNSKS